MIFVKNVHKVRGGWEMARRVYLAFVFYFLFLMSYVIVSEGTDLTGTWESSYKFGPLEESMITTIQQVGDNIIGSFLVKPLTGPERSGILFGTVEGENVKVNLLSVKDSEENSKLVTITFIDGRIEDEDTLKGTYYVHDSKGTALSGSYEAIRK
jgi:hypothetical protein